MRDADLVWYHHPRLASAGDVDLCHDSFGDPEEPTTLLIMARLPPRAGLPARTEEEAVARRVRVFHTVGSTASNRTSTS